MQPPLLDDQAAILYMEQPGLLSDGTASGEAMPSRSHQAVAPAAIASRAISGVCSGGLNTLPRPICSGTSPSLR